VFATLINSGSGALEVNASLDGDAMSPISFSALDVAYIVNQRTRGDFNTDGTVNAADIRAMLGALTNLATYKAEKGLSDSALVAMGDLNDDNKFTNGDIQSLLQSDRQPGRRKR
jgi:hypothetical protein